MFDLDQSATWQALEARLERADGARQRAILQTVIDHAKAEAAGDVDGLMATLVAEPQYHFWTPLGDVGPKGHEAVRRYYEDYVASGAAVFSAPPDRIVVDDDSIAYECTMTTLAPWEVASARGYAIPEEAGHYALDMRTALFWTFDQHALAFGEDTYSAIAPDAFVRVDDRDLPPVYLDYLSAIGR